MKKTILLAGCAALLLLVGCKKKEMVMDQPKAEVSVPAQAAVSPVVDYIPPQSAYGTVSQCPVTKEKVTVGKDTAAVQYAGKVYYMCCPSCLESFKADPEKFK